MYACTAGGGASKTSDGKGGGVMPPEGYGEAKEAATAVNAYEV